MSSVIFLGVSSIPRSRLNLIFASYFPSKARVVTGWLSDELITMLEDGHGDESAKLMAKCVCLDVDLACELFLPLMSSSWIQI